MWYIKFKIKQRKNPHYFLAYLFETKKDMRNWYDDYVQQRVSNGASEENFGPSNSYQSSNFAAIVIPFQVFKINDGVEAMQHNIGICLFHRGALGSGLISHEMLHCALWFDRVVNGNTNAQYGEEVSEEEERLAYLLTDFVRGFVNKLYKLRVY